MKVLAIVAAGAFALAATGAPRVPGNDAEVLERLPAKSRAASARAPAPGDLPAALAEAQRLIERSRLEADPRYLGRAQASLSPWWSQPRPPNAVRLMRATILQSRHEFDAALSDLDALLAAEPANAQALLVRATVYRVLGRPEQSQADCLRVPPLGRELALLACATSAASLAGRASDSYAALDAGLRASPTAQPEVRLWSQALLADMARRLGRPAQAEVHFRNALALGLRDPLLLADYADLLIDQGRPRAALELLGSGELPDALLLRRAIARTRLGDAGASQDAAALRDRFAAVRRRGDTPHLREEARFALDVQGAPAEALRLALGNWKAQREPGDLRLVLESAAAANAGAEVQPVLAWWRESKLEDVAVAAAARRLP